MYINEYSENSTEETEETEENNTEETVEDILKHIELYDNLKGYMYNMYLDDVVLNSLNCCDLIEYIKREDVEWVKSVKEYKSERRRECDNKKWEERYKEEIVEIGRIISKYIQSRKELRRIESYRDEKNLIDFIYSYSA
jgi:hypothetical protein